MKRIIIAGAAGIAAVAAVTASAASLGGFTGQNVGASSEIVAACQDPNTDIGITYDSVYNVDDSSYWVTEVTISDTSATCNGLPGSVTLVGVDGEELSTEAIVAIANNPADTIVLLDDSAAAADVVQVALVITGGTP